MRSVNIRLIKNTQDEGDKIMYEIMSADEAIRLIRDGDCICVNSFVGIENPTELHEAIYRRYQKMQSPTHLTIVSSAGFGVWDEEHNAERYIKEGAVDKLICGHFGAMLSTKKLVLSPLPNREQRGKRLWKRQRKLLFMTLS